MTLEQLDTAINAWVWIDDKVGTYGPGIALTASLWAAWAAVLAARRAAARIRTRRELRHIEHYANHKLARRLHTPDRKENET
ncbi:hypothetical protein ACFWJU_05955 [Streptomyces mutabilis]|uniref:hypothetical protein n=1 Tax=Streptomyces mutabilis TaxID=67332 RepID=UPI0036627434